MVTGKHLLCTIESSLLGATSPSPSQRIELMHAILGSLPHLRSLLSFPPPKASDRAQVQSKEVRLRDSGPISLDDQDVQNALSLSDDLHLNEIDCVRLLVSANQEWGLQGRTPLDILRLASGLWYTERRDLITALYTLLRAVVLDQGLDADLQADIIKYVEDLVSSGLRQRLVSLIKELNREDSACLGGPNSERHILDSSGALMERRAVVYRERLIICHCLVLSLLVVSASPNDVKDILATLKDSAGDIGGSTDIVKNQIAYSLLFSLIISLISDALSASPDKISILSQDVSFAREFQETVMAIGNDQLIEGCMSCIRLAWAVHLMIIQDVTGARETTNDGKNIVTCLEAVFSGNVFQFLLNKVLWTPAYQNDDEDMIHMYNAYLHKLISSFLSHPLARDKVKETKDKAMAAHMHSQQAAEPAPQTFVSLLEFVSEIYEKEPELLSGNDVLWKFVKFAGDDHTNDQTLVAFLKMLSTLASSEEGASKVYELLQGRTFRSISWSTLFDCLSKYEEKFKESLQNAGPILPEIQEGDAKALVAYLCVLCKVVENGNPNERKTWFPDIEPLFKLLSYENVPPYLKGALRDSIATFIYFSPNMKDTIWGFLEQYNLPAVVRPQVGQLMGSQIRQAIASGEPFRKCTRCLVYSKSCSLDCGFRMAFPPHIGTGPSDDVFIFNNIAQVFEKEFLNAEFAWMPIEKTREFRNTLEFICDALSKDPVRGPRSLVEKLKIELADAYEKRDADLEKVIRLKNMIYTLESEQVLQRLLADVSVARKEKAEREEKLEHTAKELEELEVQLSQARKNSVVTEEQLGLECKHSILESKKMLEILDAIKVLPDVSSIEKVKQVALGHLAMASGGPFRKCARCSVYSKSCSADCNFRIAFPAHTGTGPLYDVFTFKQISKVFGKDFLNRAFAGMQPEKTLEFRKTLEFICEELSKDQVGGPLRLYEELKLQIDDVKKEIVEGSKEVDRLENIAGTLKSQLSEPRKNAEVNAIKDHVIGGQTGLLLSELDNLGRENAELLQKLEYRECRIDDMKDELKEACEVVIGSQDPSLHDREKWAEIAILSGTILEEMQTIRVSDLSDIKRVKKLALGIVANLARNQMLEMNSAEA